MIKYIKPYRTYLVDQSGNSQCLYSWTFKNALEWAKCSLRSDYVMIKLYRKAIVLRSPTMESNHA